MEKEPEAIKMTTESDTSVPWMDRAWMQNVLRDVENDQSLSITYYHVTDMSSKGDHYFSEIHSITVHLQRTDSKESKMSLIAKKLPPGEEITKMLSVSTAFPNEIRAFTSVLPRFEIILDGVSPGLFQPFAARHIYSQHRFPFFLIVSDLTAEGFSLVKSRRGLDLDHCLPVMKALGRFHAVSVALHGVDAQTIEAFKENFLSEDPPSDLLRSVSKSKIVSLAKVVRCWPDCGETMADKLLEVADTACQQMREQILRKSNRLNVLTHGDLWTNNLLFKYNDVDGSVEDIRMVDFQMCCYASCAIDLQYFIHISPRDDVRIAHTEDILREYHSELCSTLQLLGLAEKAITFQELMEEYDGKGVYGFFTSLLFLPLAIADTKDAVDVEALLSGGDQAVILDIDKRPVNKDYEEIMKRLLPLFEQKGYF